MSFAGSDDEPTATDLTRDGAADLKAGVDADRGHEVFVQLVDDHDRCAERVEGGGRFAGRIFEGGVEAVVDDEGCSAHNTTSFNN